MCFHLTRGGYDLDPLVDLRARELSGELSLAHRGLFFDIG